MKNSTQKLPGVKRIFWLDAERLQRYVCLHKIVNHSVGIFTDIHPIEFADEPDCRCKTEYQGGGYSEVATLKFLSPVKLPLDKGKNYGFVVTDILDNSYLIGSLEPPHAIYEPEIRLGTPAGDAAGYYYEIKHTAYRTMIPCVISDNP